MALPILVPLKWNTMKRHTGVGHQINIYNNWANSKKDLFLHARQNEQNH